MLTTSLLIGLAATLAVYAAAARYVPIARPPARSPQADPGMWMPRWPHEAPRSPFTVPQARRVMQMHRACTRGQCKRKDAAWMTLVDAGHIRPRMPVIGGIR
jgi:hypothetical protein